MSIRSRLYLAIAYFATILIASLVYASLKITNVNQVLNSSEFSNVPNHLLSALLKGLSEAQLVFAILGVVGIFSVSYFLSVIDRHLLGPLDKLQRFTDEIARGKTDLRFTSEHSNEISRLGDRINYLLDLPAFADQNRRQQLYLQRRLMLGLFRSLKSPAALLDMEGDVILSDGFTLTDEFKEKISKITENAIVEERERRWQVVVLQPASGERVGWMIHQLD